MREREEERSTAGDHFSISEIERDRRSMIFLARYAKPRVVVVVAWRCKTTRVYYRISVLHVSTRPCANATFANCCLLYYYTIYSAAARVLSPRGRTRAAAHVLDLYDSVFGTRVKQLFMRFTGKICVVEAIFFLSFIEYR